MAETTRTLVKPRVHLHLVKTLAQSILRQDFKSGSLLPSESELCETLNISRSALREAIKVRGTKGLVAPRPRTGTLVRPRDDWNLLDPDLLAWSMEIEPSAELDEPDRSAPGDRTGGGALRGASCR